MHCIISICNINTIHYILTTVTMGHGQQELHFDTMTNKHSMNPTVYLNYPSGMSMAQPVTSAPTPYKAHAFHTPLFPFMFPSDVSPRDARGREQSSSMESLYKSHDFTPMSVAKGIKSFVFF